ncbi:MAG: antibiotic biosynthesis monooxygenase family protein [Pseudomonadota bacterium]
MLQLHAMDPAFPIDRQLELETGPVVLVNLFTLAKADETAMLQAWTDDAQIMKRQPGYISTQLHRAIGDGCTYLNYAIWESTAAFRSAFGKPEFQAKFADYPSSVVAKPHLFEKIAVPGFCVA